MGKVGQPNNKVGVGNNKAVINPVITTWGVLGLASVGQLGQCGGCGAGVGSSCPLPSGSPRPTGAGTVRGPAVHSQRNAGFMLGLAFKVKGCPKFVVAALVGCLNHEQCLSNGGGVGYPSKKKCSNQGRLWGVGVQANSHKLSTVNCPGKWGVCPGHGKLPINKGRG